MVPTEVQARPGAAHELGIVVRLAARAIRRRLRGEFEPTRDFAAFRAELEPWLERLPSNALAAHVFHYIPATCPPWFDTGTDVAAGDTVTLIKAGRVFFSRLFGLWVPASFSRVLDIWVPAWFQVWCRIGDEGPIFRGTRDVHTFTAQRAGRLWLANYFPGEWGDANGRLATSAADYSRVGGGTSVLVLRWARGADPARFIGGPGHEATSSTPLPTALARCGGPEVTPPGQWQYLWNLGPAEIYRPSHAPDGRPAIGCHTHGDAGILHRDARLPLRPGTKLRWSWRVDELPADLDEDTLPSHDYVSIAVEFDDGQDLTYYWSASLPVGKVYRCPLLNWTHRETHVVVRSGPKGLGEWLDEERDLHADYVRYIGGPAREIVRVWLIANSLLSRGHGRCQYAGIELDSGAEKIEVL